MASKKKEAPGAEPVVEVDLGEDEEFYGEEIDFAPEGEPEPEVEAVAPPSVNVWGQPHAVNTAISDADIHAHTDAANLLDTAKTRLEAILADRDLLAAFPGGEAAVRSQLKALPYIAANPDIASRFAAAKAALDATY